MLLLNYSITFWINKNMNIMESLLIFVDIPSL